MTSMEPFGVLDSLICSILLALIRLLISTSPLSQILWCVCSPATLVLAAAVYVCMNRVIGPITHPVPRSGRSVVRRHPNKSEAAAAIKAEVPEATDAECQRWAVAFENDVEKAALSLSRFLKWRPTIPAAVPGVDWVFDVSARTDTGVANVVALPQLIDTRSTDPDSEGLRVAKFVDSLFPRDTSGQVVLHVDVTYIAGQPNASTMTILRYVSAMHSVMQDMFPERMRLCIVTGMGFTARTITHGALKALLTPPSFAKIRLYGSGGKLLPESVDELDRAHFDAISKEKFVQDNEWQLDRLQTRATPFVHRDAPIEVVKSSVTTARRGLRLTGGVRR